jgi:hypothetical protein
VGVSPTPQALTAADVIPVSPGAVYYLVVANSTGALLTVVIDDPTTPQPEGAAAINPDVSQTVAITTGLKVFKLRTSRFRDASGNINLVNTNFAAGTTAYVIGPVPDF